MLTATGTNFAKFAVIHQTTSILPYFLSSSWNETTAAGSDEFCGAVGVYNRRMEC